PPTARVDCIAAGEASIAYNEATPGKERVSFSWGKPATAMTQSNFGDPVNGSTAMWMCIYGPDDALIRSIAVARAGDTCAIEGNVGTDPCWKSRGKNGWAYADKSALAGASSRPPCWGDRLAAARCA
ncbi:MAG: hypothetical protein ACKOCT_21980, partial [Alphaproteobacteria bacterium]